MAQNFVETMKQTMALYRDGSFAEAYALLTQHGAGYPDQAPMVLYLRSCLAARIEQPQLAIELLGEAVEREYWYNQQVMRESPSWQPLQGVPAFERLAEKCKTLQATAEAETRSQLLVAEPQQGCTTQRPCPLALAFHGNGDNAANALEGWRAFSQAGWLLAAVQSSQIVSTGAYVWDDQAVARTDIECEYARLKEAHPIDPQRSVLVGFSMGAQTALRLALSEALPTQGFVLLGPGGPTMDDPASWQPLIEQQRASGLRGYILIGAEDQGIPHDSIRTLVALLNAHGVACGLEVVPGLDHEYPPDSAPYVERALAFIDS